MAEKASFEHIHNDEIRYLARTLVEKCASCGVHVFVGIEEFSELPLGFGFLPKTVLRFLAATWAQACQASAFRRSRPILKPSVVPPSVPASSVAPPNDDLPLGEEEE